MTDPVDTDALRAAGDALSSIRRPTTDVVTAIGSLFAAADEVDRLRAAIESAPHEEPRDGDDGYGCQTNPCTCWKADVL